MNTYKIRQTDFKVSRIAYGCMGIGGRWNREPITVDERKAAIDVVEEWHQLFVAARGGPMS